MNKREKDEKKSFISKTIDLANGRFKDSEINILENLVKNRAEFNGSAKSFERTFDGFSSDGRYRRNERTTFTIKDLGDKIHIEEITEVNDDDGYSNKFVKTYKTGREIINILKNLL